ncbi:MAG: LAGLIDADG family homing endonuclease [Candidatus Kerfeldbacteria bacterium]|nr:LAGLIDADG family homing endonuclease [Candidatus Kerfeldbacteria bacterium]
MKPLHAIDLTPSAHLYYVVGLITTDGSLSKDGRHIVITSKDLQLLETVQDILKTTYHIGRFSNGITTDKRYYRLQIGDVRFYKFLLKIGLMPNKSKILGEISIPQKYFMDFLRGHFDGDGTFYSYYDPRWKSSFMFYTVFCSASQAHVLWLQKKIHSCLQISGHITSGGKNKLYQVRYAKKESQLLIKKIYYKKDLPCLERKRVKIEKVLTNIKKSI